MHRKIRLSAIPTVLGTLVLWLVCASSGIADEAKEPPFGLRNGRMISENLLVGGQPTPEQLEAIVAAGFRSVVNLRGVGEDGSWDESSHLDLPYLHLPIASSDQLDADKARQLAAWLADPEHLPAVVHCASGNRVGALFSLKAFHVDDKNAEEALEIGRAHGLKSLEAKVETLLETP